MEVPGRGTLELPFTFRPCNMERASAHILVEITEEGHALDGIKWQFPVKGYYNARLSLVGTIRIY